MTDRGSCILLDHLLPLQAPFNFERFPCISARWSAGWNIIVLLDRQACTPALKALLEKRFVRVSNGVCWGYWGSFRARSHLARSVALSKHWAGCEAMDADRPSGLSKRRRCRDERVAAAQKDHTGRVGSIGLPAPESAMIKAPRVPCQARRLLPSVYASGAALWGCNRFCWTIT